MDPRIEPLESRTLLSAPPSVATLTAERKAVLADLKALATDETSNVQLIQSDLRAAGRLSASKPRVRTLSAGWTAALTATGRSAVRAEALVKADANRLEAVAARLAADPGDAALQARLTAADNTLQGDAASRLAAINADVTDENDTNSSNTAAIESENSGDTQLATAVTDTIDPRAEAAGSALLSAVTTAIDAQVSAATAALPA